MNHFTIGAHLKVARMGYTHHGIYIGNGQVIHYAGFCEAFKSAPVEITSLEKFQGSAKKIKVVSYDTPCFSPQEIVRRAKSRLHEDKYHLLRNNCEHFATWCVTGKSVSKQVRAATKLCLGFASLSLFRNPIKLLTIARLGLL